MTSLSGTVLNIQRYSIDDGPGIRTTVFLKGCPLRCRWCSNPESQKPWPEVVHRDSLCKQCLRCVEACEVAAITVDATGISIDRELCTRCGRCVEACVNDAMRLMGKEMSVDEVFAVIQRDADYYRDSGGGVTLSGGEVLSQADFALSLLKRCREAGIHTCVDTSGQGDTAKLQMLIPYTDLFYFDLKHLDPDVHKAVTGHTNELIIRNFEEAVASGVPVVVRVPVITGVNDTAEDIAAIARKVASLTTSATVHLLPYHRFGSNKYAMLDLEYELEAVESPPAEFLETAREVVQSFGLTCDIAV